MTFDPTLLARCQVYWNLQKTVRKKQPKFPYYLISKPKSMIHDIKTKCKRLLTFGNINKQTPNS